MAAPATAKKHDFLQRLGLGEVTSGVQGAEWLKEPTGGELVSLDPTSGEPIGRVLQASEKEYEAVLAQAHEEFLRWRLCPAPRRGLAVRALADALRAQKDDLGRLVSLEMGKIAAEHCDEIILTDEDPYDEKPEEIISQISSGFSSISNSKFLLPTSYFNVLDRREAIRKAISTAKEGDTVILTGKGSEDFIHIAKGKKIPWSERKVVEETVKEMKLSHDTMNQ